MRRSPSPLRTAAILLACAVFAAVLAQAGPADAASRGFRVYNFSSHPLKLIDAEAHSIGCKRNPRCEGSLWEGRPLDGAVLAPGAAPHAWELQWNFLSHVWAVLTYQVVGTKDVFKATLDTFTTENDSTCTISVGGCTAGGLTLTVTDPPGTVRDIPAGQSQEQAATLRDLCRKKSSAKCEFKPTSEVATKAPSKLVGDPVANCTEGEEEDHYVRGNETEETNSLGIKVGIEAETNFIFEKAKVSVETEYGHEWTTKYLFKQEVIFKINPGHLGWVASAAPVFRDTGDFTLKLGNTTWILRDVYFDTPDPARTATFVTSTRVMTAQEVKDHCKDQPPGPNGLTRVPDSLVSIHHLGTGGHDTMFGGPESNWMRGLVGNDLVHGAGGNDILDGGPGNDRLFGDRGNDTLDGGQGRDVLYGGPGRDTLNGGRGPDHLTDLRGPTRVRTGTDTGWAQDTVDVRDGHNDDTVFCGTRRTLVTADRGDRITGHCGKIIRPRPAHRRGR